MHVLTYNIRYDTTYDKHNEWKYRKNLVISNIQQSKAQIIGLQECLHNQIEDILEGLGGRYSYIGKGRDDGIKAGEYSPIIYDNQSIKLEHHHQFWISEKCYEPGSKSWNTTCCRILTWGYFRELSANKTFYFLNTHLDHQSKEARAQGAMLIKTFISTLDKTIPVCLVGDFNDYTHSVTLKNLLTDTNPDVAISYLNYLQIQRDQSTFSYQNLYNSRDISAIPVTGPKRTFTGFTDEFNEEIDYIIVNSAFKVDQFQIVNNNPQKFGIGQTIASDHLPVTAILSFK
ncbi:hypothetical protein DLAC_10431 [Tieghemostelium lacteum]|uniref:Endonuclease/exonuclease/phosphatase domain-containing protein n=1 Tax=Tieghemostelium lacteum TaxID=361077 RepID=A0A151Z5J5_TIELA|nr:hypothetical protein DLAC_10431 [Tieghemostelium lacteum]|eukprot:KYQ89187.1 hypothetical protein DLAC_10431 [Tieghemostelium lacteum]